MILRDYQWRIVQHILDTPRCAIWAGMGLGKTVATLTALDTLSLTENDVTPVLVIAPLRVARSTWPEEVAKWTHLKSLSVAVITGTEAERRKALKQRATIYTINYENLPWLVDHFGERWPFKTVVADESTKLKGFRYRQGGQRARALGKVAHKYVRRFIELTGTPSPNGLADLWGQAWYIDAGQRLGRTFTAFTGRFFQSIPMPGGYSQIKPLAFAQEQIQDRLRDVCLTIDAKDHFDLQAPIVTPVFVDMPPKAMRLYRDFEREMFMQLGEHEVEAFSAAARTVKCLQLANGAAYVGEDNQVWEEVHHAKLDALEDIIEEAAGAPVLVAYHFRSDLARIQKAIPKARALDHDPRTIAEWNAGQIPVLLAHPASAGHGLNLQHGGNIIAFFGHWWNLEEHDQIIERIGPVRQRQAGYERPVFVYYIVSRGTVDELVMARRETKREVQDLLLDAMKPRT